MIDNYTYIPGASTDFFSDDAYKERMAAYIMGIRKYKLKENSQPQNKAKNTKIGGGLA